MQTCSDFALRQLIPSYLRRVRYKREGYSQVELLNGFYGVDGI